jgi:hypothetical protein
MYQARMGDCEISRVCSNLLLSNNVGPPRIVVLPHE